MSSARLIFFPIKGVIIFTLCSCLITLFNVTYVAMVNFTLPEQVIAPNLLQELVAFSMLALLLQNGGTLFLVQTRYSFLAIIYNYPPKGR